MQQYVDSAIRDLREKQEQAILALGWSAGRIDCRKCRGWGAYFLEERSGLDWSQRIERCNCLTSANSKKFAS